jgi:hypothetical protein
MTNDERDERIAIWNSFFKLAWLEAKSVYELSNGVTSSDVFDSTPPPLPDDQHHVLAAVLLCNLAIEARANHLIEDLIEQGKISAEVGKAAQRLSAKHKWFLIPTLAGVPNHLSSSSGPHQAVAQLCDLRNDVLHVNYSGLKDKLPNSGGLLSFFRRFVEAMEDMNVLLGKGGRTTPKPEVLRFGTFETKARGD